MNTKNNILRHPVMEFSTDEEERFADDEDVKAISQLFIEKNRQAYEVLAK